MRGHDPRGRHRTVVQGPAGVARRLQSAGARVEAERRTDVSIHAGRICEWSEVDEGRFD